MTIPSKQSQIPDCIRPNQKSLVWNLSYDDTFCGRVWLASAPGSPPATEGPGKQPTRRCYSSHARNTRPAEWDRNHNIMRNFKTGTNVKIATSSPKKWHPGWMIGLRSVEFRANDPGHWKSSTVQKTVCSNVQKFQNFFCDTKIRKPLPRIRNLKRKKYWNE